MLEILNKLKPGEIVLVEYSSKDDPSLFFIETMKWAELRNYQVLITDLLNRIELCLKRVSMKNFQCEALKKANFIEIGYHELPEVNMIGFLRADRELPALFKAYRELFEEVVSKQFTVILVTGIERWILMRNEGIPFVNALSTFLGDTRRIAFYFVNRDVLSGNNREVLSLLEDLATTIIEFKKDNKRKLVITKALNTDLEDYEMELYP
ncbi:DUF257 family protein [Thermococcus alcaliphilus]|uniref:DUF257 family protein n=1 Tax=Thermococcus alcaliphilus TaxID=139207 RepID=UPI00209011E5|nr:DUF257 family protein [Thermococcus alcaliphilus]MCO6040617.1 DUF257 domain-containing protein [Thermococcus alcaliphilus]